MRTVIAVAAGVSLALGSVSLARADAEKGTLEGGMREMETQGVYDEGEPAYDKDPRQLMPDENPLKGVPGEPRERAGFVEDHAAPPQCGKDPRQLMPSENPLKGHPHEAC